MGLTDEVITELYRRARNYAEARIVFQHREDAVQHGMCEVLRVVTDPHENYPESPEDQLDYLTSALNHEMTKFVTRKLSPDTNIPCIPE